MVCLILAIASILSLLTVLLTVLYLKLPLFCPCKRGRHKITSDLKEIHQILSPPLSSRTAMLEARAIANNRLIHAFGFTTSTFTSSSPEVNQSFRRNAAARIRMVYSTDDWKDTGEQVLFICKHFLPPNSATCYDYDKFIQVIVFTTVLYTFFQVPIDRTLTFAEVSKVTDGINTLWIASKSPGFQKTGDSDLIPINHFLGKWIDFDRDHPFTQNPLEIIIPAYETMWRLVAHAYGYIEAHPEHRNIFLAFANDPTMAQFKAQNRNNSVSAEMFIQETLRRHPPTKRIKRAVSPSWMQRFLASIGFQCLPGREIVSANIEGLHTSEVWGPLPHEFDAMRHRNLTDAQKRSFLPFGYGPFKCIATEFAPRFAGIILGSLLKIENAILIRGEIHGEREGWNGWEFGI